MLFFYVRHGYPTYEPNELTPLGHRQADAIAKRLSLYGLDQIYSSVSNRAVQTAEPTCQFLNMDMTLLEFADEHLAHQDFSAKTKSGTTKWIFDIPEYRALLQSQEVAELGHRWYEHPQLAKFKEGWERIDRECTAFFASLGYERVAGTTAFRAVAPTDERVALFAHAGFGKLFFSWLMHIPLPQFSTQTSLCHTGMSVVEFADENGLVYPNLLTYSSDSHLYREGLPLDYNQLIRF